MHVVRVNLRSLAVGVILKGSHSSTKIDHNMCLSGDTMSPKIADIIPATPSNLEHYQIVCNKEACCNLFTIKFP